MSNDPSTNAIGKFALTAPVKMWGMALLEPKAVMLNGKARGEPKYHGSMVFSQDHVDLAAMKQTAIKVARAAWPGIALTDVNWPFKAGNDFIVEQKAKGKKTDDLFVDKVMFTARSQYQPKLAAIKGGRVVDFDDDSAKIANKGLFYAGVEVLVEVNFSANTVDGKNYVSAYLDTVLSTSKGDRLASGRSASETFRGYVGHTTNDNPAAGLDDEIPF